MSNRAVEEALNVFDLRLMAKKRLPKWLFEFVDRGTEDEVALRNNRAAFERIKLKTQVLVDVSKRNQDISLFGKQHKMPIGIAPTGPAGMLYYKGELELARAAKAAGIPLRWPRDRRRAWKKWPRSWAARSGFSYISGRMYGCPTCSWSAQRMPASKRWS